MKAFGVDERGDRNNFKIVCCKCGDEADLIPTHYYEDNDGYGNYTVAKITLEFHCACGNTFETTIHKNHKK